MSHEQTSLEAELRDLQAASLDPALLLRLEAAADGTLTRLTHEEIRFEAFLRGTPLAKLTPDFLARLETVVHEIPFPVNEKIVLFPKASSAVHARRKRPMWAAAAAVALIGAATALLMPAGKPPAAITRQNAPVSPPAASSTGDNFVPTTFNRGLSEVRDEGVVWKSNNQPHSLVRVVYQDKITVTDANGRTFQVEQPRVEYMLVPAKTD